MLTLQKPRRVFLFGRRRALAFVAVASLASFAATREASAQWIGHGPWCAVTNSVALECNYYSLAQCMARAYGISNACSVNPWYIPRAPRPDRPRRTSRR
jgi:hypothetical protein